MPDKSPGVITGILAALYAGALIVIYALQNKNITAVKEEGEKKVPTTMCNERTDNVRREIGELKADTSKQWEVIGAMNSTVIEIKTILESMVTNLHKRKEDD